MTEAVKINVKNLNFFYGKNHCLYENNINIYANKITAIIGPSGCGKSTHIRAYNRMFELYPEQKAVGEILIDNKNILDKTINVTELRKKVGMIFQKPVPFPMSIYENIAYGIRVHNVVNKIEIQFRVEQALKQAALWDEVKDKLYSEGASLSGGQQQRLCIARAIAIEPEILLMDEPTSAIDPVATAKIEDLLLELKKKYTVVLVTHNIQQAARIADYTAFFLSGSVIEYEKTKNIFANPKDKRTENYITGKFN